RLPLFELVGHSRSSESFKGARWLDSSSTHLTHWCYRWRWKRCHRSRPCRARFSISRASLPPRRRSSSERRAHTCRRRRRPSGAAGGRVTCPTHCKARASRCRISCPTHLSRPSPETQTRVTSAAVNRRAPLLRRSAAAPARARRATPGRCAPIATLPLPASRARRRVPNRATSAPWCWQRLRRRRAQPRAPSRRRYPGPNHNPPSPPTPPSPTNHPPPPPPLSPPRPPPPAPLALSPSTRAADSGLPISIYFSILYRIRAHHPPDLHSLPAHCLPAPTAPIMVRHAPAVAPPHPRLSRYNSWGWALSRPSR
ncbi:hypothetical protein T492DRAFT_316135, partial [Pavlovales sp. CCMP2436]